MPGTFVCFAPKNFWKNAGCGKITSTEDRGTVLPFVYTRISCYVDLANAQYRTWMTYSNIYIGICHHSTSIDKVKST